MVCRLSVVVYTSQNNLKWVVCTSQWQKEKSNFLTATTTIVIAKGVRGSAPKYFESPDFGNLVLGLYIFIRWCYPEQRQGLEAWGQGQGLVNWSSRTRTFLEDKDFPRGQQHWVSVKNGLPAWLSGNVLVSINIVALLRARLILGLAWFTGILSRCLTKPPRPTQPGHPSVGRHNEYCQWKKYACSA